MPFSASRFFLPAFSILLALLAGCEAMSPAQCATADWRQRGIQDGMRGSGDRAAAYYESCSKAGQPVDIALYRAGRDQGLQTYCRLDNAMNEGLAGRTYGNVCPPQLDQNFRMFHQAGQAVFNANGAITRLNNEQRSLETELRNSKTSDDRKRAIRERLSRMDNLLAEARDAARISQQRLDHLRSGLRY